MSDEQAPNNPIAITGMHRSGTSMITRGLHESGLHLIGGEADALLAAADDNPEGFWENKAIVACNDDLLEAAGGSWDNPPSLLPVAVDDPRLAEVVEPATAALAGLAENERWGFKDPRTCLTAAFWLDLQPDLRFVICVRNPLEVALSLKRRNQNSYSLGLALWERYYQSVLELVPEDRRIVTHYDTYFLDPEGELGRVCDFAGLDAAPLAVRTDLRHHDVGVSLDEANLGASVQDLYARLCDEAGVALPPRSGVDEGQVRRLVLDGTVSARHAEQRQQAIERLEERLREVQQSEKTVRDELSQVRRESESRRLQLQATKTELDHVRADFTKQLAALEAQGAELLEQNRRLLDITTTISEATSAIEGLSLTVDRVEGTVEGLPTAIAHLEQRQQVTLDRTNHVSDILDAVHVKLRAVEDGVNTANATMPRRLRRFVGRALRRIARPTKKVAATSARKAAPVAKQTAKATAKRMPEPVQGRLRRVRRAVVDGQAPTRVRERVVRVVDQLPGPAQTVARKGGKAIQRSGAVPKASRVARGVLRRLPGDLVPTPSRPAPARPAKKAVKAPRPAKTAEGRAVEVPKGPASFKWQKSYERLVSEFVAADAAWAVVTPGCKGDVTSVGGRTAVAFPSFDGAAPAADSLSLVAILETLRLRGTDTFVLPEGARAWYSSHPELRDHVSRRHRLVVDREAAGAVFDLTQGAGERRGLLAEVREISAGLDSVPAILNWTDEELGTELPGFTTFAPAPGATLPYFDDSVDVVVTTPAHDLDEARRVASVAVVVCARDGAELLVDHVDRRGADDAGPAVIVVAAPVSAEIDAAVREAVDEAGAEVVFDADPAGIAADVVVVVEAGVVPLPGSIAAAVAASLRDPDAVSVAKVLDDHGRLESAGGTVFADGSVAGIAEGTLEVRAPWHEFNRPVCWGGGLIAAVPATWAALPALEASSVVEWCGAAWQAGHPVYYRSDVTSVRASGSPRRRPAEGGWSTLADRRPSRPADLGDGAWRYLLANDDVAALRAAH